MLVVEDLRVHHPGMTVDRVMQIPVAPAGFRTFPPGRVTGPAGRAVLVRAPAEHPPPATVGDAPELFDVDVDHRPITLLAVPLEGAQDS